MNVQRVVNVAVIGAGWWANEAHLPALGQHHQARIACIHSRTLEKARRGAERFSCALATDSVDEALSAPGLDAAIIASTPNMHGEHVLAALRRGLHVLVEKPLTLDPADAWRIMQEAQARKLNLVVSCPWQFTRHARELKLRLRDEPEIRLLAGSILMSNWIRHLADPDSGRTNSRSSPERPNGRSYSDPAVSGGGFLYTQLSHALSWLFEITGEAPQGVSAQVLNDGAPVELFASLVIRLRGGGVVSINGVGDPPPGYRPFEMRLFFDSCAAAFDLWKGQATIWEHGEAPEPTVSPDLDEAERYPKFAPANALIDLILQGGENPAPPLSAAHAVATIAAAMQSAGQGGAWVEISEPKITQ